mgnify:CR=1 FL=1|tara:strand:+ start:195 stop:656 length:462 start_codon:yes stop_codon:yes gene_type:complete
MKVFIKSFLIFFIITNTLNADLVKPRPTLKPLDVLLIQLNSLKNNNSPYVDAGIEQTWEFAHPNNKTITGPLNRFKEMLYSKSYEILISHENSDITVLKETENISIYKVVILTKKKKKYYYIWQVEKVLFEGDLKNCWMTTSVSNPEYIGEVI